MIARSLFGSAILHLAVLIGGGLWYGSVAAKARVEPPELFFAPSAPQVEVVDQITRPEALDVEPSSVEIELPEPILPENFDLPEAELPPQFVAPRLRDRLWSEALLEVLPKAAEPVVAEAEPLEPVEAPPPLAYAPAEPRVDLNQPPIYPRSARSQGHEGDLRLRLAIDVEGRVIDVELLSPCRYPALNRAAIKALRAWRYRPARRAGVPTEDTIIETILFRIGA